MPPRHRATKKSTRKSPKAEKARRARTAYHEAGHAILSAALGDKPEYVSIRARGYTLGRSGARMSTRPTTRVQVHLAGFAAEHLLTGRRPRQLGQEVSFGILSATDPALRAAFAGSEEQDGHRAVRELVQMRASASAEELGRDVERFYEIARESLSAVWPAVQAFAGALLEKGALDRAGVERALGHLDIYSPIFAVQRAHGLVGKTT